MRRARRSATAQARPADRDQPEREQVIRASDRPHPTEQDRDADRDRDPASRPREVGAFTGEWFVGLERVRATTDPRIPRGSTATTAMTPIPIERMSGMRDGPERLTPTHRPLVGLPVRVAGEREDRAERDEGEAEQATPEGDVELREELGRGDAGRDECERRAVPREEGPLVRVAEPDVDLPLAVRTRDSPRDRARWHSRQVEVPSSASSSEGFQVRTRMTSTPTTSTTSTSRMRRSFWCGSLQGSRW